MGEESVDELIQQLEHIRLQETRIIQRLVRARANETRANETRAQEEEQSFRIGDKVLITNKVKVQGRAVTIEDRRGIVTNITSKRIYFRTESGYNTWRARTNLLVVQGDWTN